MPARRTLLAVSLACPAVPAAAQAPAWPDRPVRLVVPYAAGGPTDAVARLLADRLSATPSQRVVRYFHSEDAATAARLAGRLGRGWAIQDFRSFEPSPAPQTLEIWLPDR